MAKIFVKEIELRLVKIHNEDYICITDMLTAKDGQFFVSDWMRNRNTLEFLGIWEMVNNPTFNCGEFAIVKMKSGLNNFKLSVKEYSTKSQLPYSHTSNQRLSYSSIVKQRADKCNLCKWGRCVKCGSLRNYGCRMEKEESTSWRKHAWSCKYEWTHLFIEFGKY